jgi:hypothetical protein
MPDDKEHNRRTNAEAGAEREESTLLPMLIAGLVLIVAGAIIVMMFV